MKIYVSILFSLLFLSCERVSKFEKKNTDGVIMRLNSKNKLEISFSKDGALNRMINPEKGYEILFFDNNINTLSGICVTGSKKTLERVDFKRNGEINKYFWHNNDFNERYVVENGKDYLEYGIYKNFDVNNFLIHTLSFKIDKLSRDTFDYFYYKRNYSNFEIVTDWDRFNYDLGDKDSIVIEFVEHNIEEKDYYSPEEDMVIPNLKGMNVRRIKNSLVIPSKKEIVIGTLWTFYKPNNKKLGPYSYQLLYLNGDALARFKLYENHFKVAPEKFNPKMIDNKEILNDILESGYYKLVGDKLLRDKTGE